MDFFEHQAEAKSNSRRLIILFFVSTLLMCSLINGAIALAFHTYPNFLGLNPSPLFQWKFHFVCTVFTLAVVLGGFLYQSYRLSLTGGISLALDLGATNLSHENASLPEKKLLNVVEEMAIASGVPVPEVFVLEESGINAFAAGVKNKDAVICVTRGALQTLNRDELQGIVAHEFSHILNGDMNLNMRIVSVIFGLMLLSAIGRFLMSPNDRSFRRSRNMSWVFVMGMLLLIVGSLGTFFGRMIQAALSRQREFLADASAVQFTRNPDGIGGALKKIGGWVDEGLIEHPFADQMSHFFLVAALRLKASGLFATHPPLPERIKRIDPRFNEQYQATRVLSSKYQAEDFVSKTSSSTDLLSQAGTLSAGQLILAHELVDQMSAFIRSASQSPYSARALVFSFFLAKDQVIRDKQMKLLQTERLDDLFPTLERCTKECLQWGSHSRLVLLDLSMPALKKLSPTQQTQFVKIIYELISADQKLELFEYCLFKIIKRSLKDRKKWDNPKSLSGLRSKDIKKAILDLFCWCQRIQDMKSIARLQKALQVFGISIQELPRQSSIRDLNEALNIMERLSLKWRKKIFKSCIDIVQSDARISSEEMELIRAIGSCLEIPVPPLFIDVS